MRYLTSQNRQADEPSRGPGGVACPSAPRSLAMSIHVWLLGLPVVLAESNAKLGVACEPMGCRKSVHPGAAGTGIAGPGYGARSWAPSR